MMVFQMMIKSTLGLLLGICAGAVLGGLIAIAFVGSQWVIGGMALGAIAGAALGAAAGFWTSIHSSQPAPARQPVRPEQRPAWTRADVTASGD
ncbi:MAG TPA: hypothetical protein VK879_19750 [Candidatus Sulfomarinibacteraceae bacterium]|nr:hypothetical protein [Candidatus Sulfomarinibacteraceae bacterium]